MSSNKLGIILFSSFLIFATAPLVPAQSTQDQTKKQTTTQKSTASKDDIRKAQQALKDKGMYTGAVDGTMNAETQKALRDFQQKNNLRVTGNLNHDTMTALGIAGEKAPRTEKKAQAEKKPPTGTAGTTETTKKTAKRGKQTSAISTDKVREVQTALKKEGFDPGPIDGIMGPMTMTALRNYQSHNQLQVTGTLTAETENALIHGAAAGTARRSQLVPPSSIETPQPQYTEPQQPSTRESLGVSSEAAVSSIEDIKRIQQALTDLQYNPGEINGMITAETQQAIREFQWLNDLPVTGIVDEQTMIALDTQWRGGVESAQLAQTPLSVERQKPEITAEVEQNRTETYSQTHPETTQGRTESKHHERATRKTEKDGSDRVSKAAAVLLDLTAAADKRIPNALLERAEAIAVIPHMMKGAFVVGGRYGKGVVSQRLESGRWSPPAFIDIGGGSFGAQIGGTATDLVLVFTDRKALSLLEGGRDVKLGVDAGVVAGPVGRSAEAGVNLNLESAIYAYSRSKGLFAGIALDGAVLNMDNDTNRKVYGQSVDAKQILNGNVTMNATVRPFMDALDKVVPKKRITQK